MSPNARVALAWLVPVVAIGGVIGWETQWGQRLDPPPPAATPAPPAAVKVAVLPEFKLEGGPESRRETVDRTLFNPTRRPAPPPPAAAAPAATMQRGQFALTGTTLVDGKATALLREVKGGKPVRVHKGETVNGMLVEDVRADRVRLTMNGESEDVMMKVAAGPKTTVQPAAPAPMQAGAPAQPGAAQGAVAQSVPGGPAVRPVVAYLLAQRRRAARAAEAAAAAAAAAQNGGSAAPAAPAQAAPPPSAPAANAPVPLTQQQINAARANVPKGADPQWATVYQRMMQQGR
jgi:hypothetical protein